MTLDVSVVVPTFHRDELLRRCLIALARQELPRERFEVIVVDDGRSPTTAGVIDAVRGEHGGFQVRLRAGQGRGPANARNLGWRESAAPVIAFTDDDAYPKDASWLASGLRYFETPAVLAVSGRVEVPTDDPPTDFQRNVKGLEDAEFLTCDAFCRRDALEAIGGFDERSRRLFERTATSSSGWSRSGRSCSAARTCESFTRRPRAGLRFRCGCSAIACLMPCSTGNIRPLPAIQPRPPLHYYGTLPCHDRRGAGCEESAERFPHGRSLRLGRLVRVFCPSPPAFDQSPPSVT